MSIPQSWSCRPLPASQRLGASEARYHIGRRAVTCCPSGAQLPPPPQPLTQGKHSTDRHPPPPTPAGWPRLGVRELPLLGPPGKPGPGTDRSLGGWGTPETGPRCDPRQRMGEGAGGALATKQRAGARGQKPQEEQGHRTPSFLSSELPVLSLIAGTLALDKGPHPSL